MRTILSRALGRRLCPIAMYIALANEMAVLPLQAVADAGQEAHASHQTITESQHDPHSSRLYESGRAYKSAGNYGEALRTFEEARQIRKRLSDREGESEILNDIGEMYQAERQYDKALAAYQEALEVLRGMGLIKTEATILNMIGYVYAKQGRNDEAAPYFERVITLSKQSGDNVQLGIALDNLASIYLRKGDANHALELQLKALAILREAEDDIDIPIVLRNIGDAYKDLNQIESAIRSYEEASEVYERLTDGVPDIALLLSIANLYERQSQYRKAAHYYSKALEVLAEVGVPNEVLTTVINLADMFRMMGLIEKARANYTSALEVEKDVNDKVAQVRALTGLGHIAVHEQQYEVALQLYRQALATAKGTKLEELEGGALNNIGTVYKNMGRSSEALEYFQEALAIAQRYHDDHSEVITLTNMAGTYQDRDRNMKALELYSEALEKAQALNDSRLIGGTLTNMAVAYLRLGNYSAAMKVSQEALGIHKNIGDPVWESATLNRMAEIHVHRGRLHDAIDLAQQALALQRSVEDKGGQISTLGILASAHEGLEEFPAALDYRQQELTLFMNTHEKKEKGVTLHNIGILFSKIGDHSRAMDYYRQAMQIRRKVGDRAGEASTLVGMATEHSHRGEVLEALGLYRQAVQLFRELKDPGLANALAGLGELYYLTHEYSRALELLREAYSLVTQEGDPEGRGAILNSMGLAEEALGRDIQAGAYYEKALLLARNTGNRSLEGAVLSNLASMFEDNGKDAEALKNYRLAIEAKERVRTAARLEEFKMAMAGKFVGVYPRAIILSMKLGLVKEAFELTERFRARTFVDQLASKPVEWKAAPSNLVEREKNLRGQLSELDRLIRQASNSQASKGSSPGINLLISQRTVAEKEYEFVIAGLKSANPQYVSMMSVDPVPLPDIQALLAPQTTLLSFFIDHEKSFAFIVTSTTIDWVELEVHEGDLRTVVESLRGLETEEGRRDTPDYLYVRLFQPLERYIQTRSLGIVASKALNYAPIAAIFDGRQYLGDKYSLFFLPSAATLKFINRPAPRTAPREAIVLAYSDAEGLSPLNFAEAEASDVSALLGVRPLLGREATESAIKEASNSGIIHIAAHGLLNVGNPSLSRIYLAPDTMTDGMLHVREVYDLPLSPGAFIALSACETSLGPQGYGDEVVSLSRAFIVAGASAVLSSLWAVDDAATSQLMVAFYTHWITENVSKAEALVKAQQIIRKTHPSPYYWAGFRLEGLPE